MLRTWIVVLLKHIVDGIFPADIIEVIVLDTGVLGIIVKVVIPRVDITFIDRRTVE